MLRIHQRLLQLTERDINECVMTLYSSSLNSTAATVGSSGSNSGELLLLLHLQLVGLFHVDRLFFRRISRPDLTEHLTEIDKSSGRVGTLQLSAFGGAEHQVGGRGGLGTRALVHRSWDQSGATLSLL